MVGDDLTPSKPASAPKVFNCPACGGGVVIRAQGHSVAVACRACGSIIDVADENYSVLAKAHKKLQIEPLIPLGQRGKLHGVIWEVIGYLQRKDGSSLFYWDEYLLFNPTRGFHWLMEFDGHWSYVGEIKTKPALFPRGDSRDAKVLGKTYRLFHRGTATVTYVLGEFYWRVRVGEQVSVEDYVNPPELLSSERSKKEIVWSLGQYIDADTISDAFKITRALPRQQGVAPHQPSTVSTIFPAIRKYWLYFIGAIVALHTIGAVGADKSVVYREQFTLGATDRDETAPAPTFELKQGLSNVRVALDSTVVNSWLELEADLIDERSGETRQFELGVEYYSGEYFEEGSWQRWSEGGQMSARILSSVPAGQYRLNLRPHGQLPAVGAPPVRYWVVVTRDVPMWSNFFLALALLSVIPGLVWWRSRSFEHARWSTSDFSPYWSLTE